VAVARSCTPDIGIKLNELNGLNGGGVEMGKREELERSSGTLCGICEVASNVVSSAALGAVRNK
jgi:hypothetical protein